MPHLTSGLMVGNDAEPRVQEILLYMASEDQTGAITDDGGQPPFVPTSPHTTQAVNVGNAVAAWSESINFEQSGDIEVISCYYEFEYQTQFTNGGGNSASYSKMQVSNNGGSTWTDATDVFTNTTAGSMTNRLRGGVSNMITSIEAGVNKLQFRLLHWVGHASDTSSAQIRTNSYIRLTYRKKA